MASTISHKLKNRLYRPLAILFWLAVWQAAAIAVGHEFLLASPLQVLQSLGQLLLKGTTYQAALKSTGRIMLGFFASLVFSLLLAAGAHKSTLLRELAAPLVSAARSVPVASFVILAIILVSTRWLSTLIAFVIGFPVIYLNLLEGIKNRDIKLRQMATVFRVPFLRRLFYINLPQIVPYLRAGAATALGLCFKSGIAAEVIGIPSGTIGEALYRVKVNYYTAELFAWTIIIVVLSLLASALMKWMLDTGLRRLERL
ncbi:MAG: ABC transporter permease subunit [Clostridiales bacterium]|nr:ABC transporter permease subunit [Clostridiales bacterium]